MELLGAASYPLPIDAKRECQRSFDRGRSLVVEAPAKLNVVLAVGRAAPGAPFHPVESVMAAVSLHDTLMIEPAAALEVSCTPELSIPVEENLVWRAAVALADALGVVPAVHIRLEKAIPAEAGLGGGSSDAAAALRGLCALWGVQATSPQVIGVAQRLGADVPFFLGPPCAVMGGRGDVLQRALSAPSGAVVLVRPLGRGVATPQAYARFDTYAKRPGYRAAQVGPMVQALEAGSLTAVARALANDLQPAALALKPELAPLLSWLKKQPDVRGAQVCGSGSALFGLCETQEDARRVARAAQAAGHWSVATAFYRPGS